MATEAEEYPTWQKWLDQAAPKWGSDQTRHQFLASLGRKERQAVVLADLNYQVQNGGFRQWVDNGYALEGKQVVIALQLVNTEAALAVADMVTKLIRWVQLDLKNTGAGEYWIRDDRLEDDEDSRGEILADKLDDEYDKQSEQLCRDIEAFLLSS